MAPRARICNGASYVSASTNLYKDDNIGTSMEKKIFRSGDAIHNAVHTLRSAKSLQKTV